MGCSNMGCFKFTDTPCVGGAIGICNMGHCRYDFIYMDDNVEGVIRVIGWPSVECG